ncbi:hypothetical protein COV12_00820 [Candidatus Woesearchaeota archaeon CG10_big_fil_rev_8_21_14_0_10_32_24]|nr:MAG: hypothetical protein COV12_00820 [Candidatus Woesearchaeota archaeon CG10_big_fil_rev_8_21_14_0_10_32_24]
MAKKNELNELSLGYAGAAVSAIGMFLLGVGWNLGIYANAAMEMAKWHLLFSQSILGIFGGMIEAAIWGFIALYAIGWFYNKWA